MSCTVNSTTWVPPTASEFQAFFFRDFPYAGVDTPSTDLNYIQPQDINNAIALGQVNFSPRPFNIASGQATTVFMYLAAFFLVENLKNSSKGIAAQANFPLTGIGAGGVNVSMEVPEPFKKNPTYNMYTRNAYGIQYLQLVYPFTIGGSMLIAGTTTFS